jgi:[ribosomal protein S5]-alanine N-acetyltransferase
MPPLSRPALGPGSLTRLTQPVLQADELVLRPWLAPDARAVADAYSDPSIQRWHVRSMSIEEAHTWVTSWPRRWEEESGASWAVVDEWGLLGQVSIRRLDLRDGLAEVSYWVVPAARGRRVAGRALSALTEWSFTELGVHRIELAHSTLNLASCRVAVHAGYAFEGVKRSEALHADGWHDMHLHARLADDP